jgi:hypothetical protein
MLRRLFIGMLLGLVVGGLVAAAMVAGLKLTAFVGAGGAILAYASAALAGVITGLVAGKPIWASGAKIEAGLKSFFGALLGLGLMFALRQWAGAWTLDLGALQAGHGAVGSLPAASLPLIAAVLGGFFGLDNTDEKEEGAAPRGALPPGERKRVASQANGKAKAKALETEGDPGEEAEGVPTRAKR